MAHWRIIQGVPYHNDKPSTGDRPVYGGLIRKKTI